MSTEHCLARVLAIALRRHGYLVESAHGVVAAAGVLALRHFDVIVLDLSGVRRGADAPGRLRGETDSPILVLVTRVADGLARRAVDAGADDVLETPFGLAALIGRLDALTGRFRRVR